MLPPLRVCIDARVADGPYQGAGAVVRSLVAAFSKLDDGPEEFHFLAYRDSNEWLRSLLNGSCRMISGPPAPAPSRLRSLSRRIPGVRPALGSIPPRKRVPVSDGAIERSGIDVVHFTTPSAFLTAVPSIYEPHDLQHLHLPQFFTRRMHLRRELEYRTFCRQAAIVVAMSVSGKMDLVRSYDLPETKVVVVPWAPAINHSEAVTEKDIFLTKRKFMLPDAFLLYPAHTWPHKNHMRLLDALAILKKRYALKVPLVCVGHQDDFFNNIHARARKLGLESQVRFLGFVTPGELSCLYRASRCLVFPSLFEGWGLPLMEAFSAGTPVACSDISPLREQALDAALMFNPENSEAIALAIQQVFADAALRQSLVERGHQRASLFNWEQTVRTFRALYRKIARRPLSAEDCHLLTSAPLV